MAVFLLWLWEVPNYSITHTCGWHNLAWLWVALVPEAYVLPHSVWLQLLPDVSMPNGLISTSLRERNASCLFCELILTLIITQNNLQAMFANMKEGSPLPSAFSSTLLLVSDETTKLNIYWCLVGVRKMDCQRSRNCSRWLPLVQPSSHIESLNFGAFYFIHHIQIIVSK